MEERGQPIIRPADKRTSLSWRGAVQWLFSTLIAAFLFPFRLLWEMIQQLLAIFLVGGGLWLILVWLDPSLLESPSRPEPPKARYILFESSDPISSETNQSQLALALAGGSYELSIISGPEALKHFGQENKSYIIDFKTGRATGDPKTANQFVVIGNVNISFGYIDQLDTLRANLVTAGKSLIAHIEYDHLARGPPVASARRPFKRLLVLGEIKETDFPRSLGSSLKDLRVLELSPTQSDFDEYRVALREYERKVQEMEISKRAVEDVVSKAGRR